jgi:hypothetical protein
MITARFCGLGCKWAASSLTLLMVFADSSVSSWVVAAPLDIPGRYNAGGPTVTIGTLAGSITGGGSETGVFTLDNSYRALMSDASGSQFRFFQVITYDDEPEKWNGAIITAAGTADHTGDVVDVPKGGWDYQKTQGNKGGDDNSPFYESDTANNPSTGDPYFFPTLSYPALHTADGTNPGKALTGDAPGLDTALHATLFNTFIAFESPALLAAKTIDVLGGYSWGIKTDASGVKSSNPIVNLSYSSINVAMVAELQGALNRSGFAAWTIESNAADVPEPSTLALAAFGFIGLAAWGWRRRK